MMDVTGVGGPTGISDGENLPAITFSLSHGTVKRDDNRPGTVAATLVGRHFSIVYGSQDPAERVQALENLIYFLLQERDQEVRSKPHNTFDKMVEAARAGDPVAQAQWAEIARSNREGIMQHGEF